MELFLRLTLAIMLGTVALVAAVFVLKLVVVAAVFSLMIGGALFVFAAIVAGLGLGGLFLFYFIRALLGRQNGYVVKR
ncbi:MAG TPA: hypothetical protein VME66_12120 [Candidatus Acidoferrales bacterium]|nr:hypothetical protein [Candidatus Acidoferrales bacterium]